MSNTIAHRPEIHIPWTTIAIVVLVALAAAAVLVLINQPADVTVGTSSAVLTAPGAAVVPQLESHAEILALTGRAPAAAQTRLQWSRHNFPVATSLDSMGAVDARTVVPTTRHNFPAGTSLDSMGTNDARTVVPTTGHNFPAGTSLD